MKYWILVCALALHAVPGAAQVVALPLSPAVPHSIGLAVPAQHRCFPSHCICNGTRAVRCTRDCRRDRSCMCVRGRYICSYYISG